MRAVWITAAEEPYYLNLTEFDKEHPQRTEWNSLMPGYEEKKSEGKGDEFALYFEKYDKKAGNPPMSALWGLQLGSSQNEIIIRNLAYDIPLVKFIIDPIPRKEEDIAKLDAGTLFRIRPFDRRDYIIPMALKQEESDYFYAALHFITIGKEEESIVKFAKAKLNFLKAYATRKVQFNRETL